MTKKRKNDAIELSEEVTMSGEFVPSFDQWVDPEQQKRKAKVMQELTKMGKNQFK